MPPNTDSISPAQASKRLGLGGNYGEYPVLWGAGVSGRWGGRCGAGGGGWMGGGPRRESCLDIIGVLVRVKREGRGTEFGRQFLQLDMWIHLRGSPSADVHLGGRSRFLLRVVSLRRVQLRIASTRGCGARCRNRVSHKNLMVIAPTYLADRYVDQIQSNSVCGSLATYS